MRKRIKCVLFAVLRLAATVAAMIVGSAIGTYLARETSREDPPLPTHVVFKDHSPKPPLETVDTMPPLSAEECIAALNASYEQRWAEEQAKSNRKESLQ